MLCDREACAMACRPCARAAAPPTSRSWRHFRMRALKTRITSLLGIDYPIVQGGMMWVGRAELASAVSNAGGLGILTALTQPDPDALAAEIARCRRMTAKPFGVNLTMLPSVNPPPYERYLDVVIRERVRVLETAGNVPEAYIAKAK